MGSAHFASALGYKNVIAGDMGGTSFDVGLVVESNVRNYEFRPDDRHLDGRRDHAADDLDRGRRRIDRLAQSADGQPDPGRAAQRRIGPGPACYDLGGTEPTVTDADLVLGYINPETYFGGRMQLDKAKAERAIRERIADAARASASIEAAALIRRIVDKNMASAIKREMHLRGYKPGGLRHVRIRRGRARPMSSGFKQDVPRRWCSRPRRCSARWGPRSWTSCTCTRSRAA